MLGDSPNRYIYVHNNPLVFVDPLGEQGRWFHEGIKDQEMLPHYIYERWVELHFPSTLEQFWPLDWKVIARSGPSIQFMGGLGNQQYLDRLALELIEKNPYDPKAQTYEFTQYLELDIFDRFYSPEQKNLLGLFTETGEIEKTESEEREPFKNTRRNLKAISYLFTPLSQRVESRQMVCAEYAFLTSYVLARAGIKSANVVVEVYSYNREPRPGKHAFVIVKIGDVYYRVDPALEGDIGPLVDPDRLEYSFEKIASPWLEEFQSLIPFENVK
jgi:hypothetical protein